MGILKAGGVQEAKLIILWTSFKKEKGRKKIFGRLNSSKEMTDEYLP
jgi:hypothetical protein